MALTTPDWLARHGGEARKAGERSWFVYFDGEPQYVLSPEPTAGKFSCSVMQTVNGRRLESGRVFPSAEEALQGGLEDLRKALGW
jgi:hypothetical protein